MTSPALQLIILDLLTFGIGFGLMLTQPDGEPLLIVGKILVITGMFVQFHFLKMMSCMGGMRT
jgi:hypothetical protein